MLKPEEIYAFIQDDITSERKRLANIGRRYYDGKHDILNYRLFYYNSDGQLVEDKTRSNIKISHPFFTELVDQCVQYMLSSKESIVLSDDPDLQDLLDTYFDSDFKCELSDTVTDVCKNGFGYMYAYKNSNNKTSFVYADAMGVVEVRAKDTDDHTEYVIYWYVDRIDKGQKKIKRIQIWDKTQVTYFVQVNDGQIEFDKEEPINPRPHIIYSKDKEEGTFGDSLGYIPFFRIDNNRRQTSHLAPVKALIDDYDLMACGLSNNLQDVSEALYVVKGFQGDNLEELVQNLKVKKRIGVDENGDVDIKTIDIPVAARQAKLDIDEKNIYRFGMGFNSAQIGDGNVTNVVIRSRYALLDLKCNKLEARLRAFLKRLAIIALTEINEQNGTDYSLSDIYFDLPREIMTNAIDNAQIEKTKAETKQIETTTILNLLSQVPTQQARQDLCSILGWDYAAIKDDFPEDAEDAMASTNNALQMLNGVVPE
ncbi:phage portal protein [Oscillospiraceae bacterium LCP25S3_E4]